MPLSHEIQERVSHVLDFHRSSKLTRASPSTSLDAAHQPSLHRQFDAAPKVALSTNLMDISASTLELMNLGLDALPDSYVRPTQNLRTLSSWLFYAAGVTKTIPAGDRKIQLRSSQSCGRCYPCEIYVAAFGIEGLDPGLYHLSLREFALRKLRGGEETLWQIKRGRPDLEFLKTVPAVLLVSTNLWRSAWKYGKRGYRLALLDAGHQTESVTLAARGLGIQTIVRMRMAEGSMRELIGIPPNADFGSLEPVQSMVVWADEAVHPLVLPKLTASPPVPTPIARPPLSAKVVSFGSIAAVHTDCTASGVVIREIRPPVTELSPLPPTVHVQTFPETEDCENQTLRQAILGRRSPLDFVERSISRDALSRIVRVSFRGGSYYPLFPDGPHAGLVRPFWIVHDVNGMEPGIWYYHPPKDQWSLLRTGHCRKECRHMSGDQDLCGNASAVCFMATNLSATMNEAGPDCYRIAHLESGLMAHRMAIVAQAIGLGCSGISQYFDEEVRHFLGIDRTNWEIIYAAALGYPAVPQSS